MSAACKQRGVSRTQYYEYKRRFQTHGIEGLVDLPPVHLSHPATTSAVVEERIIELSLAHPAWGCHRLGDQRKLEGISLSAITIQKLLNRHDLRAPSDNDAKRRREWHRHDGSAPKNR